MMTLKEAINAWRSIKDSTTYQTLQNKERHDLIHEILHTIGSEIRAGRYTYEQFEMEVQTNG